MKTQKQTKRGVTVALDGPAGAGKSTVAKLVASRLGYALVDTGAIYRSVALLASRQGVAFDDDAGLERIVETLAISFRFEDGVNHVRLEDEDVTLAIRTPEISQASSQVSARSVVRAGLLALQRRLAGQGGAVLEGRDIGTVVCPDAPVKFFVTASPEERARRRYRELEERGTPPPFEQVLAETKERDARDEGRQHAPLRPAEDAIVLDCTSLDVEAVVERILEAVRVAERRAQQEVERDDQEG